jgi:hypothetical protein
MLARCAKDADAIDLLRLRDQQFLNATAEHGADDVQGRRALMLAGSPDHSPTSSRH